MSRLSLTLVAIVAASAHHEAMDNTIGSPRCYRCFDLLPSRELTTVQLADGREWCFCKVCLQRASTPAWILWAARRAPLQDEVILLAS